MKLYFTFVVPEFDDAIADQVYARRSDASIGKSNGILHVAFDRAAASLESTLSTATSDLKRLGISPLRVEMEVSEVAMAS